MRKAAAYTEQENILDALRLARLFKSIVDCPAVVIARVQGAAYGGGCDLVAQVVVDVEVERRRLRVRAAVHRHQAGWIRASAK
jgi:1,4-dihydroxy-2-naphthoyl-CoA synthase